MFCEGLSNYDVRGARRTRNSGETRPGAGSEIGDFVKKKVGGANVERLLGVGGILGPKNWFLADRIYDLSRCR